MKIVVAAGIVLLTVVCCLAVSHLLDLKISQDRNEMAKLHAEHKALMATPEGVRWLATEDGEPVLNEALLLLDQSNDSLSLTLAALDGLGTKVREIDFDGRGVTVRLTGDTAGTLARLRKMPGGRSWSEAGPGLLRGEVLP